jgi:hypothetical protein
MEDVDFLMNFVVKFLKKLQKIKSKKENELSMFQLHTQYEQHMLCYLSMKDERN